MKMKRFYMLILGVICGIGLNLNAAIGDDVMIVKFELPDQVDDLAPLPMFTIDGEYTKGANGKIVIESRGLTMTKDGIFNRCFDGLTQNRYNLLMDGNTTHSANQYSYIVIRNEGYLPISKIVAFGVSKDGTLTTLEMDASTSGNANLTDNDYESLNDGVCLADYIFPGNGEYNCYDPDNGHNSFNPQDPDLWDAAWSIHPGSEIRTVRLRYSNKFNTTSNTNRSPRLQALYVYVEDDGTATHVESIEANFDLRIAGDVLEASQPSDVTIYSLNGIAVKSAKGITSLPISDLQQGIYVVKALSANGQSKVIKMVR